jgi:hypothetical protein
MRKGWLVVGILLALGALIAAAYTWEKHRHYRDSAAVAERSARRAAEAASAVERSRAAGGPGYQGDRNLAMEAELQLKMLQGDTDSVAASRRDFMQAAGGLGIFLVGSGLCFLLARRRG